MTDVCQSMDWALRPVYGLRRCGGGRLGGNAMTDDEKHILEQFIDDEHGDHESIPGAGIFWGVVIGIAIWVGIFALVKWWP